MKEYTLILKELTAIKQQIGQTTILQKEVLTFGEMCQYLQIPESTGYKYTSKRIIPHFKKQKRLIFSRSTLDKWLLSNPIKTKAEIETDAQNHIICNKKVLNSRTSKTLR